MSRWPLRIVSGLLILHGALGFAITPKLFPGLTPDSLGFAQHGFAFIFLALLNLASWQQPRRTRGIRLVVHACNVAMLGFYALWCVVKPEPPNYTAAVLLLLLTLVAAMSDLTAARSATAEGAPATA